MLGGAIFTITRRSAVHSAICLIVSLIGVAGLYLLQQAEFLFAVQIVLYIGGIMVLFLFVIMLVNLDQAAKERQFNGQWWIALAVRRGGGRRDRLLHAQRRERVSAGQGAGGHRRRHRGQHRADRRRAVLRSTCCRSKSLPCCCWWRWSARW